MSSNHNDPAEDEELDPNDPDESALHSGAPKNVPSDKFNTPTISYAAGLSGMQGDRKQIRNLNPGITLPLNASISSAGQAGMRRALEDLLADDPDENRYVIEEEIQRGGMGIILRAIDRDIRRPVAMKVMLAKFSEDSEFANRFIEEAQITGQLEHPNIVPVHEMGLDSEGDLFFTMKLVEGRSLAEVLDDLEDERNKVHDGGQPGPTMKAYPLSELLGSFLKICDGVAYAHSRGVLHRDLKPENVMLGNFGEVLVMDWGLAKALNEKGLKFKSTDTTLKGEGSDTTLKTLRIDGELALTMNGSVLGTPAYMSPEQARGDIDTLNELSDEYALGAILYEMLCLHAPYEGEDTDDILQKVISKKIIAPEQMAPHLPIPQELSAIAMKAMARDPQERYETVMDLAEDIRRYLSGRAVLAKKDSPLEFVSKLVNRNRAVSIATALAAAAILIIAAGSYVNVLQERDRALEAERLAHLANQKSLQAKNQETRQRALAETARKLAEDARDAAETSREEAKRQGAKATLARLEAELDSYITKIRLVKTRIGLRLYKDGLSVLSKCPTPFRHWEWHYLSYLCDSSSKKFHHKPRFPKRITQDELFVPHVAVSKDGTRLFTATNDYYVDVWDLKTGKTIRRLTTKTNPQTLALTPSGEVVMIGNMQQMKKSMDVRKYDGYKVFVFNMDYFKIRFSKDRSQITTMPIVPYHEDAHVKLWDTNKLTPIFSLPVTLFHGNYYRLLKLGLKQIFLVLKDKRTEYWDVNTGQKTHMHLTDNSQVRALAISSDSKMYATLSHRGNIVLWDTLKGKKIKSWNAGQLVWWLSFSPKGKILITGSTYPTLWNIETAKMITQLSGGYRAGSVAFSPNERFIFAGGKDSFARMWWVGPHIGNWALPAGKWGTIQAYFAPSGETLIVETDNRTNFRYDSRGTLRIIDKHTGVPIISKSIFPPSTFKEHTSDKELQEFLQLKFKLIQQANAGKGSDSEFRQSALKWYTKCYNSNDLLFFPIISKNTNFIMTAKTNTTEKISIVNFYENPIKVVPQKLTTGLLDVFEPSPDGEMIAGFLRNVPSPFKTATHLNMIMENQNFPPKVPHLEGQEGQTDSSPSGKRSIQYEDAAFGFLWDRKSLNLITRFKQPAGENWGFTELEFLPGRNQLVGRRTDAKSGLVVFDLASGLPVKRIKENVSNLTVSPDGKQIAAIQNQNIIIWSLPEWKLVSICTGHHSHLQTLAFFPDGKRLVSGGNDKTVRIWDPHSGKEVLTLKKFTDIITHVDISPKGGQILVVSGGRIQIFYSNLERRRYPDKL